MKQDRWLIVALLVSVGVNVWLALELRELRRGKPDLRQLEKVEKMLAELRKEHAGTASDPGPGDPCSPARGLFLLF